MTLDFFSGLSKQQVAMLAIGVVIILLVLLGVTGIIPIFKSGQNTDPNFPAGKVLLKVWGVGDEGAVFSQIGQTYKMQDIAKNVSIQYTKFDDEDTYQRALTEALASGQGPDIFMVKNTWIPKDIQKLYPAPSTLLATLTVQKSFPQAVAQDTIKTASDGLAYVYALPLHFDALALFYNKDIFNAHAIVYPPTTWDEVVALVPKLRVQDAQKNITLAPIALGSTKTIEIFDDVLTTLMMQSGATITKTDGQIMFDSQAQKATEFFLQFSNPSNVYYGWNDTLGDARDAFASQKLAMMVDYYSATEKIKAKNNFIQMEVAPLPQISSSTQDKKTLASYWTLGVSRVSQQPYVAWHFVRYLTLNSDINTIYLTATKRLPALLSLMQKDLSGENGVFLKSFLYARTWLRPNNETVKASLARMIENITLGRTDVSKGLRIAQEEINSN